MSWATPWTEVRAQLNNTSMWTLSTHGLLRDLPRPEFNLRGRLSTFSCESISTHLVANVLRVDFTPLELHFNIDGTIINYRVNMDDMGVQLISKTKKLKGKTIFLTGNSKSIGRAIALKAAQDGANVVFASDIDMSDIAKEVDAAGGRGFSVKMDIRHENHVEAAVEEAANRFGGIDILINNSNLITSTDTEETSMKDFDEVYAINVRGTFLVIKMCLPYLKTGKEPHILNISPPINLHRRWFAGRVSYTMAKYGMSMCVLGMAQEFKGYDIMVNSLWPRNVIENENEAKSKSKDVCRKADIMGDAAYSILTKVPKPTGIFYYDDQALKEDGIVDFDKYCVNPKLARQIILMTYVDDSGIVYKKSDISKKTVKIEKHEIGQRLEEVLQRMESLFDEKLVKKVNALYQITVTGTATKETFLDLRSGSGQFRLGIPSDKPDLHLTMDEACFYEIFVQGIKPMFAYTNGRFTMKGDESKILLLDNVIVVCKSKI
ncbi:hypothetical protein RN001_006683 [Aquatica leii]|uniref:Hydroxysteroid dehydrogenase-like protein 2 n=1 Tax=Aquatica leii TaxID=1421715 RepID=A0AAN7SJZ2_9COLE|nr:hypothetical protein RN001_006683 [Aquatica leii]